MIFGDLQQLRMKNRRCKLVDFNKKNNADFFRGAIFSYYINILFSKYHDYNFLKVLFILYGVSFFVPYLRTVSGHLLLPTLVLSIYCKIKFPHDKFVKVAFVSCIVYVVLYVLLILFLILACMDLGGAF